MKPGIYLDIPEETYHGDPCSTPSLSSSIAQALVLESPAHAYLRHPKLGGQPFKATAEMNRGTLIHAILLGKGITRIEVVECDDWKKKDNQAIRDALIECGKVPVTRPQYDNALIGAHRIREKLKARGYEFTGHSEVSVFWNEEVRGVEIPCRARLDHLISERAFDLKITGDANPETIDRQIANMGYDIQSRAYTRALDYVLPHMRGRTSFELLFCEPEPPYCVTPTELRGTFRELGERKWERALSVWERCLRENRWPDYVEGTHYAEAKPWQLAAAGIDADN